MEKTIIIDGKEYTPKNAEKAAQFEGMDYVICRTYSAGVFAGFLEKREGKEAIMRKARRLWYWSGAASLSQLSVDGTSQPADCKFPCEVDMVTLTEVIEILPCTAKAKESIENVPVWTA